jgi:hypothetical protein
MSDDRKQDDGPVVDLEVMKLGLCRAHGAAEVVHHENSDFDILVFPTSIQEVIDPNEPAECGLGFYLTSPEGQSSGWECGWDCPRQDMEQVLRLAVRRLREWGGFVRDRGSGGGIPEVIGRRKTGGDDRGVRLESLVVSGVRYTSKQAIARFMKASAAAEDEAVIQPAKKPTHPRPRKAATTGKWVKP